jgi:hypothetical protein
VCVCVCVFGCVCVYGGWGEGWKHTTSPSSSHRPHATTTHNSPRLPPAPQTRTTAQDTAQLPNAGGEEAEACPAELLEGRADFFDVVPEVVVAPVALYVCVCVCFMGGWEWVGVVGVGGCGERERECVCVSMDFGESSS